MKKYLLVVAIFCSCHNSDRNGRVLVHNPEKTFRESTSVDKEKNGMNINEWKQIEYEDSVQLKVMLKDLLRIASQNRWRNSFHKESSSWNYQNASCSASLSFGYLFSKNEKHLITRRSIAGSEIHIDIFVLRGTKFKPLLTTGLDMMGYLGDTVRDVNGDFYKDYLFHWYSSAGCCRRDVYAVYLYDGSRNTFSKKYTFMNPTFSSKEKIIRGVEYGHPGEVPLYKYKWNGTKVDTIEFIYPDTAKGKFYLSKIEDFDLAKQKGKVLNSLPQEYRNIESIDWFLFY